MQTLIGRLEGHHREILPILEAAAALLAVAERSQLKPLGLSRWHLMRALRAYQIFKHVEIFDPAIARGTGMRSIEAARMKQRCVELADAYGAHVKCWSCSGPSSAWHEYRRDASALVQKIGAHLSREAREIPLLLLGEAPSADPVCQLPLRVRVGERI